MTREKKDLIINDIVDKMNTYTHFYLTDVADLNAAATSALRRSCFKSEIILMSVKNTLIEKAFEKSGKNLSELTSVLKGSTSIMFSQNPTAPAKLIKELRKKRQPKPILKGAFVQESIYIGDNQLDNLVSVKSREELIADIVFMLKSPMNNVMSALESGKNTIHGVLTTLSERE